jgi:hypothetical protein
MTQAQESGRGCLFYTGIAVAISVAVLIAASYIGYRYAKGLIQEFSATQPMSVPTVQMPEAELSSLHGRMLDFSDALERGRAAEPLIITADELNALIVTHSNLVTVRGNLFFSIEGTNVSAQMSVPAQDLGFKPLEGRYVNATATFTVGFSNGVLDVNAQTLSANGKPFPDTFVGRIRPQNFAYRLNHDPGIQAVLGKVQDVRIHDGKVEIVPKPVE